MRCSVRAFWPPAGTAHADRSHGAAGSIDANLLEKTFSSCISAAAVAETPSAVRASLEVKILPAEAND